MKVAPCKREDIKHHTLHASTLPVKPTELKPAYPHTFLALAVCTGAPGRPHPCYSTPPHPHTLPSLFGTGTCGGVHRCPRASAAAARAKVLFGWDSALTSSSTKLSLSRISRPLGPLATYDTTTAAAATWKVWMYGHVLVRCGGVELVTAGGACGGVEA